MELTSNHGSGSPRYGEVLWGGAKLLRRGMRWKARNGQTIFFWKDVWLGSRPLDENANGLLEEEVMENKVVDYWEQGLDGGGANCNKSSLLHKWCFLLRQSCGLNRD